jgi:hypothetical protein
MVDEGIIFHLTFDVGMRELSKKKKRVIEHCAVENYNQQLNNVAASYQMRGYISQANELELPKIEFEKIRVAANINVKFVLK